MRNRLPMSASTREVCSGGQVLLRMGKEHGSVYLQGKHEEKIGIANRVFREQRLFRKAACRPIRISCKVILVPSYRGLRGLERIQTKRTEVLSGRQRLQVHRLPRLVPAFLLPGSLVRLRSLLVCRRGWGMLRLRVSLLHMLLRGRLLDVRGFYPLLHGRLLGVLWLGVLWLSMFNLLGSALLLL